MCWNLTTCAAMKEGMNEHWTNSSVLSTFAPSPPLSHLLLADSPLGLRHIKHPPFRDVLEGARYVVRDPKSIHVGARVFGQGAK